MFQSPIDIANRALQHVGNERIDQALGFSEVSKNASECAFAYPLLRRAELRRNVWRFAIRRAILRAIDVNTLLLTPAMWVSTTTYFLGSIVSDQTGTAWISKIPNNLGNQPENSLTWEQYFGPLSVSLYSSTTAYSSGELVYTTGGDGTSRIFMSLQNANSDNPATATAWSATATYFKNQVVTYLSVAYMSKIDLNTNQTPSASPALWSSATTYGAAAQVGGSDGVIYTSIAGGNLNHDPTTTGGVYWTNTGVLLPWTTVFVGGSGSLKWLQIGGAEFPLGVGATPLRLIYPVGSGPSSQSTLRNVFRLPAGYLRKAPTDPKAGATSYLGASWGLAYTDWNFEGNYITSSQTDPIPLRFVADLVDVTAMDDMFCEMLAVDLASAICEPLTQSTAKLAAIKVTKKTIETDARTVNGIEVGPEELPVDDYIQCRM